MMYIIDFFGQINFSGKVKEERICVPQFVNWTKLAEKRDPAMQQPQKKKIADHSFAQILVPTFQF